jgi:8-amino-7-oxononanoate synthase
MSEQFDGTAGVDDRGFDLAARLAEREERSLRRDRRPADRVGTRAAFAPDPGGDSPAYGDERLVFAANDYLGLADDDRVADAAATAAREVGTGAGASRLVTGDTGVHRALERDLAAVADCERALAFSSGYAANVGTIAAIDPDVVFSDALNHASIVDGCRLSGAEIEVYDHADAGALAARMNERAANSTSDAPADGDESWLVVTDSVFSMDGDVAPLGRICDMAERHGAWVMVDEAHATGLHEDGGGIIEREGLTDRVDVQLGTLSKALGAQGGYVAGSESLVEWLVNAARSFAFSTGLAPPAAAAARESLRIARGTDRRETLWENVDRLRNGLVDAGFDVWGESQILPVVVGDRDGALALADALEARGVVATAIRPPSVPEGTSRLRAAPTAAHTPEEIDRCVAAFRAARREVGLE